MKMFTVQVAVILVMSALQLANGQVVMILPTDLTVIEGDSAEFSCSPFVFSSLPVLQIRPDNLSTFENIDNTDPRLRIVMDFEAPNDPTNRTYSYSNLQRDEDGTQFTCSVNGNDAATPVTITVYYPPTYTAPGDQVVVEGMDIVVTLTVEARPAALTPGTLTRFGGAAVPDDTTFDAVSVAFMDVERADAGVYTLTSSNVAGQGSVSFSLDVQYAPVFTEGSGTRNNAVMVGDSITLDCVATGNPDPTVTITTAPSPDPHGATISSGVITIASAADVPGPITYMCMATNTAGSGDTLSYALYTGILATVSNLVVVVEQDGITVTISWSFTDGGIPRVFLSFQLDFVSGSGSIMRNADPPNTGTTVSIEVQSMGVDLEERTTYTLTVTAINLLGDGSQAAQQMFTTGQVMILPTDLTVIEGDSAEFACSPLVSSSLPVLQIRPDNLSTFENIDDTDPRLRIVMDFEAPNDPTNRTYSYSNLQRDEAGTQFTCSVNSLEATTPVTIMVYYPPTYTAPVDQVVVEGMDITVMLTVEARPAALTPGTLTRSGGAAVPDDTTFNAVSVTFVDAEHADAGLYTLTSSNVAGQGSVNFTLDVQSSSASSSTSISIWIVAPITVGVLLYTVCCHI